MTNWYDNIPAPVDSNGRVVPLDIKELVYNGETRNVYGLAYSTRLASWRVAFMDENVTNLSSCTLLDSWERLEEDIQKVAENEVCSYFDKSGKPCDDCPAHRTQDSCLSVALNDVMRRTKALAWKDANGCNEERGRM